MGGFIIELPILHALKEWGRLTRIEVVVRTPCDALLENYDWIDAIHVRDRGVLGRFRPAARSLLDPFDLRLYLRQRGGIDLGALFVRSRLTLGVESFDPKLGSSGAVAHKFSILRNVLGDDMPTAPPVRISLRPTRTDEAFSKAGFSRGDRILSIGPGAGRPRKMWPEDRFCRLIGALGSKFDRIALLGSPSEMELCDSIAAKTGATSLAGRLEITQTAALLAEAELHVGNDSALGHLAASQGCPAVAIGPAYEYFTPWRGYSVPGQLQEISVDEVVRVVTGNRLATAESVRV